MPYNHILEDFLARSITSDETSFAKDFIQKIVNNDAKKNPPSLFSCNLLNENFLILAINHHNTEIADLLLDLMKEDEVIWESDNQGRDAFYLAIMMGYQNLVKKLLAESLTCKPTSLGYQIWKKKYTDGKTALHLAARQQQVGCLELLLAAVSKEENALAIINETDNQGSTILHSTTENPLCLPTIVELLISHGASMVIQNNKQEFPVEGNPSLVYELAKRGFLQGRHLSANLTNALIKGMAVDKTDFLFLLDTTFSIEASSTNHSFLGNYQDLNKNLEMVNALAENQQIIFKKNTRLALMNNSQASQVRSLYFTLLGSKDSLLKRVMAELEFNDTVRKNTINTMLAKKTTIPQEVLCGMPHFSMHFFKYKKKQEEKEKKVKNSTHNSSLSNDSPVFLKINKERLYLTSLLRSVKETKLTLIQRNERNEYILRKIIIVIYLLSLIFSLICCFIFLPLQLAYNQYEEDNSKSSSMWNDILSLGIVALTFFPVILIRCNFNSPDEFAATAKNMRILLNPYRLLIDKLDEFNTLLAIVRSERYLNSEQLSILNNLNEAITLLKLNEAPMHEINNMLSVCEHELETLITTLNIYHQPFGFQFNEHVINMPREEEIVTEGSRLLNNTYRTYS